MNLIDTHVDTITTLMDCNQELNKNDQHISIDRLHTFDKKGIYFSIWLSQSRRDNPYIETLKAIDYYYNQLEINSNFIKHANTFTDFNDIFDEGKTASILCLEGGEAVEGNIDNLYALHEKGVRLLTLTWNNDNAIGSGVLGSDNGLTDFGKDLIRKSNNLNLAIDISHLNRKGFFDVVNLTEKPIIASHSNCYSIHNAKRNLHDDQLQELRNLKSYVSFTIHSPFVNGENSCTLENLLPHIDHLLNKLGEDYVSIGTDFDGTTLLPCEIYNISSLNTLYNLLERTYNTDIANKIFYQNQLNFLSKII